MTEKKDPAAKVITEPAWLDYDRFVRDCYVSCDPTQYFDDCFAAVQQLGAHVERQVDHFRRQVEADTDLNENSGMVLLGEIDVVDQMIAEAADMIDRVIASRRQNHPLNWLQPALAVTYRHLQQADRHLTNAQRQLAPR